MDEEGSPVGGTDSGKEGLEREEEESQEENQEKKGVGSKTRISESLVWAEISRRCRYGGAFLQRFFFFRKKRLSGDFLPKPKYGRDERDEPARLR
ncbi:uncharacterized protein SPSK_10131 [Sporothrix schenckii 1099-18]|uniref:Uncharacterized protein n=1 Tax=Sporothrix schenckii 1099-18 TaxID=1397361 RepID=A0A0F2M4P2_SPOSC|nr:uncharacterized protein SPSK_10131 [Sporothrix schenckii 1099-18]KJR84673.1 hypothetical protein SPSK_10131 [Sporothrix schenckii 1099-18]